MHTKASSKKETTTHGNIGCEIFNYIYWIINDASNQRENGVSSDVRTFILVAYDDIKTHCLFFVYLQLVLVYDIMFG